jgi:tRNA(Ile)-lysidine synthase
LLKTVEDDVFSISIQDLLCLTSPKTILYELLQPFGFTRPVAENIFHSLPGESGKIFDTPCGDYQLLKDRTSLLIYRKPQPTTAYYQIKENDTGIDYPIRLSIRKVKITPTFKIDKSPLTATFDYQKIRFPLILRKRQSGDRFFPFGMIGKQKVSDYFSDHKFSILQKNKTWLLCSGKNILWIVGERTDNRFRISKNTKYALIIKFITQKNCK